MSRCCAIGCERTAGGYSRLCDLHKARKRRHGDAEQDGVTVHELAPYRARVRTRIAKNASNATWGLIQERWAVATRYAATELQEYATGVPYQRHMRESWESIGRIARDVEPTAVVETVLSMYLLQEERPGRFTSDNAFDVQLVRRVSRLAYTSAGEYYDARLGRTKRVYKDMKPRTIAALAQTLREIFGLAGLTVARLEQSERDERAEERTALHSALGGLQ